MDARIESLLAEAEYELFHYPEYTAGETVKYRIKRLLRPENTPLRDPFFWPQAMLAQSLMAAVAALPEQEKRLMEALERYYAGWVQKGMPVSQIDHAMHGTVLLYLYGITGKPVYRQGAEKLYRFLVAYREEMGGTLPYRKHHPTHVYVDGLGMAVPFLCRYASQCNCPEAAEMAMAELKNYWSCGMDAVTGLPYHGYDTKTKEKQGIIGWGRAVGWLMLALADSLPYVKGASAALPYIEGETDSLPYQKGETDREWIIGKIQVLAERIASYMKPGGDLSWQLQALEGPSDSSAMAMIGCALGSLQDCESTRQSLVHLLEKALLAKIRDGKIYQASGECMGYAQYPQVYGAYPWSLGPGLRFLLEYTSERERRRV